MHYVETVKIHDLRDGSVETTGGEVLVDRLWPRGVAKADVDLADWLKNVAPSPDLRKWFDHDPDKFKEFSKKYRAELDELSAQDPKDSEDAQDLHTLLKLFKDSKKSSPLILVFAAKDREVNHAEVLAQWLRDQ